MKFSDLHLKIGSRIQLQVQGKDYKPYNCEARLLGFKPNGSVLVTIAEKPPQVTLMEGLDASARLAVPAGLVDFKTSVEQLCESPYKYLHLSYPDEIQLKPLRSEARFKFTAPFSLAAETSLGMKLDSMAGQFLDISLNGARVALEKKMGDIVTKLIITTEVTVGGIQQTMPLTAEIKRSFGQEEKLKGQPHVYGVSFIDVSAEQQMLLMALCYELNNEAATNFF